MFSVHSVKLQTTMSVGFAV